MIVGLTGGVGSGKSLVSGFLSELGARIIDADKIAREILEPGEEAYKNVVEEFGKEVTLPDGSIDRKKLGSIVFSDPSRRKLLESLTHPEIIKRMKERAAKILTEDPKELIVFDAPLLIEAGLESDVDKIVVVFSETEDQIRRLKAKEGLTRNETLARIRSQLPMEEKLGYADYVIRNTGSIEELKEEAEKFYRKLTGVEGSRA